MRVVAILVGLALSTVPLEQAAEVLFGLGVILAVVGAFLARGGGR